MEFPLLNQQGASVGTVELRDDVFAILPHEAVVHQALVRQLSNARQGTHSTKTRGEVDGSTRKLYKQKGTGRARQGSIRAPHRRGGGIVFGPKPRSYRKAMPKKMRRLAIRSVLSAKAKDSELILLDALDFETPKTKAMVQTLERIGVLGPALVVSDNPSRNLILSGRNAPGVFTLPASQLNVGSMLSYRYLVMTLDAARKAEALWGQDRETAAGDE